MAGGAIAFKKKLQFVYVSLIFALILLAASLYDHIRGSIFQDPTGLPPGWRISLLVVHIVSMFIFLVGFIYSNEAGEKGALRIAMLALVFNIVGFLLRITYEVLYIDYHPFSA